jgi:hypothetical protein
MVEEFQELLGSITYYGCLDGQHSKQRIYKICIKVMQCCTPLIHLIQVKSLTNIWAFKEFVPEYSNDAYK